MNLNLRLMGGSGSDLLICHATGFNGNAYAPLAINLYKSFRVWALDFRGHGSSGPSPDGDYAWSGMAVDASDCAAQIGTERLFGFGHSMGGAALLLAEQAQPGTFAGLYLYEPIVLPEGYFSHSGGNPLAKSARVRREVFDSRAAAFARYASRPPLNVMRADALAAYVEDGFVDLPDGRVRLACRSETEASTFEASDGLTLERVGNIGVPVAVAAGSVPGTPDPAEFAPALAEALPNGRFRRCEGLGHFGPLEAPGVIAAEVIRELLGS